MFWLELLFKYARYETLSDFICISSASVLEIFSVECKMFAWRDGVASNRQDKELIKIFPSLNPAVSSLCSTRVLSWWLYYASRVIVVFIVDVRRNFVDISKSLNIVDN